MLVLGLINKTLYHDIFMFIAINETTYTLNFSKRKLFYNISLKQQFGFSLFR